MTAPVRTVAVNFQAQGVPEVQAATRTVQRATEGLGVAQQNATRGLVASVTGVSQRYAQASLHIAAATETMARMGRVSGEAGRQVIAQVSNIAFAFGPTGALVGAVGIATMAIIGLFDRTKREAKAAAEAALSAFNRIASGNASGTRGAIADLTFGDRKIGKDATPEQLGLLRLTERNIALRGQLNAASGLLSRRELIGEIKETDAAIAGINRRIREYSDELQKQMKAEQNAAAATRDAAAALTAKKTAADAAAAARRSHFLTALLDAQAEVRRERGKNPYGAGDNLTWRAGGAVDIPTPGITPLENPTPRIDAEFSQTLKNLEGRAKAMASSVSLEIAEAMRSTYSKLSNIIAEGIASAIAGGIIAAMADGDIQSAARQWGDMMIGVMARAVADWALQTQVFAKAMAAIQQFMTLHPLAAAAAAAALYVAARAVSRGGSGRYSSSLGGIGGSALSAGAMGGGDQITRILWGTNSTSLAAGLTPRAATSITVIGPNDPSAQAAIQRIMQNADRRGRT
ncbi:MAG: hypothetical protein HYV19_04255 [Gemmatimonadetes bacterium]|nr:hypothetical protein [Gemmatimonadota bacterium]